MTCREFVSFINDYLMGELARLERPAFERHLTACPNCALPRAIPGDDRRRRAAFADPDGALPPEVPEELVRAILATRQRGQG